MRPMRDGAWREVSPSRVAQLYSVPRHRMRASANRSGDLPEGRYRSALGTGIVGAAGPAERRFRWTGCRDGMTGIPDSALPGLMPYAVISC